MEEIPGQVQTAKVAKKVSGILMTDIVTHRREERLSVQVCLSS